MEPIINVPKDVFNSVALVRPNWPFYQASEQGDYIRAGMRNTLYVVDDFSSKELPRLLSNQISAIYGTAHTPFIERSIIARIHTEYPENWESAQDTQCVEISPITRTSLGISRGFVPVNIGDGYAAQAHIILDAVGGERYRQGHRFSEGKLMDELRGITYDRIACTAFIHKDEVTDEIKELFDIVWECSIEPMLKSREYPTIFGKLTRSIHGSQGLVLPFYLKGDQHALPKVSTEAIKQNPVKAATDFKRRAIKFGHESHGPTPVRTAFHQAKEFMAELVRLRALPREERRASKKQYGNAIALTTQTLSSLSYKGKTL